MPFSGTAPRSSDTKSGGGIGKSLHFVCQSRLASICSLTYWKYLE